MHILVIGAGALGRSLGGVLASAGHEVSYWDKDPLKVPDQRSLPELSAAAEVVFLAVPSWAMRDAAEELSRVLSADVPLVSLAKGLEEGSCKTMDAVLMEVFPKERVAILGGPMLADELVSGKGGAAAAASCSEDLALRIKKLFEGTPLRIEVSNDPKGVALLGVLKNIYTLGAGMAVGLGWGSNKQGWLLGASLKEMAEALRMLGGEPATMFGPAGAADFIATATGTSSRNRTAGAELATGVKPTVMSEGWASLPSAVHLLREKRASLPVFSAIVSVIEEKDAAKEFNAIFQA